MWNDGSFTAIDFPGAPLTVVNGMNNLGEVVGAYCEDSQTCHGFSYYQGEFQTIDLAGSIITEPFGVNDLGQVVGRYLTDQNYGFIATPVPNP
jgi:hypothetical protein